MKHYEITHRCVVQHFRPVSSCWARAMLLPRATEEQVVHSAHLTVSPEYRELRHSEEFNGNRVSYLHVTEPHSQLEVTAHCLVSVERPRSDGALLPMTWDMAAATVRAVRTAGRAGEDNLSPLAVLSIAAGSLPSDMVPASERATALALDTFAPGQSLAAAVTALSSRIHRSFQLRPALPAGPAPLEEVLDATRGSSAELAHVMIAALRALGLSAMYVTGYRARQPLPGGSAAHAWVAVWFPHRGWVHLDPASGTLVDQHYVTVGWGRDSGDVWPLRVVVQSDGVRPTLSEEVTLRPLSIDELAQLRGEAGA